MLYGYKCGTMVSMKQKVYFIRHAHTTGTTRKLMYGATDVPATEEGLREIAELAGEGIYPEAEGAALYTSGMLRTEQTFKAIYGRAAHKVAPLLREINLGQFEMKTIGEILKDDYGRAWLNGEIENPSFEGGDSSTGFCERVNRGFREVVDECMAEGIGKIILVIHGAVITYLMDTFFPGTYSDMWEWTPNPGTGFVLDLEDGKPVSWGPIGEPDGWSMETSEQA